MRQVRAVSLSSYIDVARFLGLDPYALLAECGIAASALEDPEQRLPATAAIKLLEKSAERAGVDSFGIRLAECRSFASLGALSLLLQHLPTVRDVVGTLVTYRLGLSDAQVVSLEEHDDVALIKAELVPELKGTQAADLVLGLAYLALAGASHGRWKPEAVHFTHRRPADIAQFTRYFGTALEFDSGFNGFSCPRRALDIPLPRADCTMAGHALSSLKLVRAVGETSSIRERVRQSIALLLPSGRASLETVAANLDVTVRTLQRLLAGEGCAFATILNELRRELAERHLSNSAQSLTQLSASLGYASSSSFTRWFSAEFGLSPSDWRRSQLNLAVGPPPLWKVG